MSRRHERDRPGDAEAPGSPAEETLEGRRLAPGETATTRPEGAESVPAGSPLRILTIGSGALLALGLGLLARDVFAQERTGAAWLPLVGGSVGLVGAAAWQAVAAPARRALVLRPPVDPRRRRLVSGLVLALLVVQALIPLRYYFGDDRFDERFSWRMFSAVRVYRCRLGAFETRGGVERPVRLGRTIHVGWITTMRRSRESVLRRYLDWRCEQEGVEAARIVNRCVTPGGERVPDVVRALDCESGALVARGGER